jgi:hypothetical protein
VSKFPALSAYPVGAPGTLAETLWLNARHFGARTAVTTAIGTLTHADLFRRGHRLAGSACHAFDALWASSDEHARQQKNTARYVAMVD